LLLDTELKYADAIFWLKSSYMPCCIITCHKGHTDLYDSNSFFCVFNYARMITVHRAAMVSHASLASFQHMQTRSLDQYRSRFVVDFAIFKRMY